MKRLLVAAATLLTPNIAHAQDLSGIWHCVLNSAPANIDLMVQIQPDFSLYGEGSYILNGTSGFYEIRAYGRWAIGTDAALPGQKVVQLQFIPGNVAAFSLFPAWIGDPKALYSRVPDPIYGVPIETACQRRS